MTDPLEMLSNKRPYEADFKQDQESDENGEKCPKAAKVEAKSITNIYYDCLERIFDFLDLEDLLNVAETCKRLQIAAAVKFGDDHSNKAIHMHPLRIRLDILTENVRIVIHKLKFGLRFLRCFGAKVLKLEIHRGDFKIEQRYNEYLFQYINQYCANTLIYITFSNFRKFSLENFRVPFKKLEKIKFYSMDLGNHLPISAKLFPNLRDLRIYWTKIDGSAVAVNFPHLEHLSVLVVEKFKDSCSSLTTENTMNLLHANQQLKSLEMNYHFTENMDILLNVLGKNTSISKLKILGGIFRNVTKSHLNRFVCALPSIVKLSMLCFPFTADAAILFIRELNLLEEFEFWIETQTEADKLFDELLTNKRCKVNRVKREDGSWTKRIFVQINRN